MNDLCGFKAYHWVYEQCFSRIFAMDQFQLVEAESWLDTWTTWCTLTPAPPTLFSATGISSLSHFIILGYAIQRMGGSVSILHVCILMVMVVLAPCA